MTLSDFIARHRASLIALADRPDCAASPRWTQQLLGWFATAALHPDAALSQEQLRPVLICLARLLLRECTFITAGDGEHTHVVPVPAGAGHGRVKAALADLLKCLAAHDAELAGRLRAEVRAQIGEDFAFVAAQAQERGRAKS